MGVFGGWIGWCGGMERRDGRGRVGEGMSVGGRVYGIGGTGYLPWFGRDRSGSGLVWVWLPTSGICQLASWG